MGGSAKKASGSSDASKISEARAAFGVEEKHVVDAAVRDDGSVVLVTAGGTKAVWKPGTKPEKLGRVAATGINPNPKKPRRLL